MKRFFDYCYYRVSKAYRVLDDKDYCIYGSMVVFTVFAGYTLSLIAVIFALYEKKLGPVIIPVIILFDIVSLFFINKKKFERLEEHYQDERYSKLKGWLVFLFIIGSVALFFVTINLLDV